MKARVERTVLANALGAVKPAVPGDRPLVRLTTQEDGSTLTIEADDREMGIEARATCWQPSDSAGQVLVPFHPLAELVAKAPKVDIDLMVEGKELKVRAGKANMTLPLGEGDFVDRKAPVGDTVLVELNDWDTIIAASKAASSDPARAAMCGVHFSEVGVEITDSYRVIWLEMPMPFDVVAPAKLLAAVSTEGDVTMRADERTIEVATEDVTLRSGALAGAFPPLIPHLDKEHEMFLRCNSDELLEAADRVIISSRTVIDSGKVVVIEAIDETEILLQSSVDSGGKTTGTVEEAVDADNNLDDFAFGLNSRFMHETFSLLGDDEIDLRIGGWTGLSTLTSGVIHAGLMLVKLSPSS